MTAISDNNANLLEVPVGGLEPGMYIAALDRPWLETPFSVQGFFVQDPADIAFVAKHCAYVYVDPRRRTKLKSSASSGQGSSKPVRADTTSLKNEFKTAEVDLTSASVAMKKVFSQLRVGGHFDLRAVQSSINPLIDSVLRNSEAMAALVRMKSKGDYLYNHSLAMAVWAAVLGRHLGLDQTRLKQMALGAALIDVGMASAPDEIVNDPNPLSEKSIAEIRKHVDLGVDLLKVSGDLSRDVLAMVATHHERFDGSGYPKGLKGGDIPLFGRVAGLVDSYDAMITPRPYSKPRSSFEAMQEIADLKDQKFQAELVEQFLQAIGLFPTGSVVELNSGEIGVVVQQNSARRLRPKVVVIIGRDGKRYDKLVILDLAKYIPQGANQSDLWITKELEPGAFGIQPDDYFL